MNNEYDINTFEETGQWLIDKMSLLLKEVKEKDGTREEHIKKWNELRGRSLNWEKELNKLERINNYED